MSNNVLDKVFDENSIEVRITPLSVPLANGFVDGSIPVLIDVKTGWSIDSETIKAAISLAISYKTRGISTEITEKFIDTDDSKFKVFRTRAYIELNELMEKGDSIAQELATAIAMAYKIVAKKVFTGTARIDF